MRRTAAPKDNNFAVVAANEAAAGLDRFSIAALLVAIADASGDQRCRSAAAILRAPAPAGRPECDDTAALAEIEHAIANGTRPNAAYHRVARRLAIAEPGTKLASIIRRLKRKRAAGVTIVTPGSDLSAVSAAAREKTRRQG